MDVKVENVQSAAAAIAPLAAGDLEMAGGILSTALGKTLALANVQSAAEAEAAYFLKQGGLAIKDINVVVMSSTSTPMARYICPACRWTSTTSSKWVTTPGSWS